MQSITVQSPAKLNITLRVGPRREDGFHEIESLVVPIDYCDTLHVERSRDDGIHLHVEGADLPADEANLILRAARVFEAETDQKFNLSIRLTKRIPLGAGLGGGSSNAAQTLLALHRMSESRVPLELLERYAAQIGSDVPLFLTKKPAIIRGRGELVEPAPLNVSGYAVLAIPEFSCDTAAVYAAFDELERPPTRMSPAYFAGSVVSANQLLHCAYNDLEPAAFRVAPELARIVHRLSREDLPVFRMTGSGSVLYTLTDDAANADRIGEAVMRLTPMRVEVVQFNHDMNARNRLA
ncbi:MAG: 4-(cytidine 5'-diphospho)-2-C-methyl-D-erythritol kinase [Phycisphaerae bacterium]